MFQMSLEGAVPISLQNQRMRIMDPHLDNHLSILSEICDALHDAGTVSFCVQGFGEARWRVDVGTDLLVVLEQLPSLYSWIVDSGQDDFILDFYEQGVERTLVFSKLEDRLKITGRRLASFSPLWNPVVAEEYVDIENFRDLAKRLMCKFLELAEDAYPKISSHPWMVSHFERIMPC